jgi:hypothetical protein
VAQVGSAVECSCHFHVVFVCESSCHVQLCSLLCCSLDSASAPGDDVYLCSLHSARANLTINTRLHTLIYHGQCATLHASVTIKKRGGESIGLTIILTMVICVLCTLRAQILPFIRNFTHHSVTIKKRGGESIGLTIVPTEAFAGRWSVNHTFFLIFFMNLVNSRSRFVMSIITGVITLAPVNHYLCVNDARFFHI